MNRRTVVRFPVFSGYEVRVILSANPVRTAARLGAGSDYCVACFIPADPGAPFPVAYLILPLAPDEGTIAHECAHAVRAIFKRAGVRNDDEAFAYHLDYLVGRVHKFLGRVKRA